MISYQIHALMFHKLLIFHSIENDVDVNYQLDKYLKVLGLYVRLHTSHLQLQRL
jgi:hypothetical protein